MIWKYPKNFMELDELKAQQNSRGLSGGVSLQDSLRLDFYAQTDAAQVVQPGSCRHMHGKKENNYERGITKSGDSKD